MSQGLTARLGDRKVICCVGSGGVGKTTTSAAVALELAVRGRKTLVLTIDPARRLANSLGLKALGNAETPIDLAPLVSRGVQVKGSLHAMMLDLKSAWDELVLREAGSPERARPILENRLYQTLSTVLAGSLEYMAMERVWQLAKEGRYEAIVLDTPPTQNALDFLDAADRIIDVLDNDAMRVVLGPMLRAGSGAFKLFALPSSLVLRTLSRFTGADFLKDLAGFILAFEGLYEGFEQRARDVKALLASPQAAFVLVTSPAPAAVDEAIFFHEALREGGITTAAVVVNRLQRDPHRFGGPADARGLAEALSLGAVPDTAGEGGEALSSRLARTLGEQATLADLDRRQVERLRHRLSGVPLFAVPRLRRDVHDLAGLWQIDEHLDGAAVV